MLKNPPPKKKNLPDEGKIGTIILIIIIFVIFIYLIVFLFFGVGS